MKSDKKCTMIYKGHVSTTFQHMRIQKEKKRLTPLIFDQVNKMFKAYLGINKK